MLLCLLALALLPVSLAKSTVSTYDQLKALAETSSDGVIKLNEKTWDLITSPKREWSVTIELTALTQNMKCAPCREFHPSFTTVANAWKNVPKEQREKHFFAALDFMDGQSVFRKLQLVSAPVVTHYPATQGPNKLPSGRTEPFNYDYNNHGFDPHELAVQLSQYTPMPIPYKKPFNWALVGQAFATAVLVALTARIFYPVLSNRWTWAVLTIMTILVMTSGFMFVRIRGAPYRTRDSAMVPGFQNQYGAEIWTVAIKYFLLSSSFVLLIQGAPLQENPKLQKSAIYICTIITIVVFSALIKDFKVKNGGYPFSYVL